MLGLRLKLFTAVAYFVWFFDSPTTSATDSSTAESLFLYDEHGLFFLTDSFDNLCESCVAEAVHPAMLLYSILSDPHIKTLLSDPGLRDILRNIKKSSPNKTSSIKSFEEDLMGQIIMAAASLEEDSYELAGEADKKDNTLIEILKEFSLIKSNSL